ncbi:electron transport complex subunit RsxG [Uliginosibacterium sp. 31-12]|uniref:electron transport complex subunit RsxG n=1 Tax=Uliginosibacterium sp. 31-12 TaxID=3062781 RepID=UPI0026E2DF03|nr:electron transport complex subunit RsxG [Uliginosibacterium sp. 31-12]MDO6385351.1 electron transport complex subunit RsxG [Uliginosibacterium sp. 31-12]
MSTHAERLNAVWYQGVSLGVIVVGITIALAAAYTSTREKVAAAVESDTRQTLEQVLPPGYADNNLLKDSLELTDAEGQAVTVYRARKSGVVRAVLFEQRGKGYSGVIKLIMAVDAEGVVQGVRVTTHTETPGLGDKIEAAKNDWIHAFEGKSLVAPGEKAWAVKKDGGVFDQFAGATITPRAVVATVKRGLEFFASHRAQLLDNPATSAGKAKEPSHE